MFFFWVIPRRLNFICRRFGTLGSIFIGRYAYDDGTVCSETSAHKIQTPENYPEENIQHTEHGESLKSRILQTSSRTTREGVHWRLSSFTALNITSHVVIVTTRILHCIWLLITTLSYPQNSAVPSPPIYTSNMRTEFSCHAGYLTRVSLIFIISWN